MFHKLLDTAYLNAYTGTVCTEMEGKISRLEFQLTLGQQLSQHRVEYINLSTSWTTLKNQRPGWLVGYQEHPR
jgi:hypothetical protein